MKTYEDFFESIEPEGECWIWDEAQNGGGYGSFGRDLAHRWSYENLVGPIPPGLVIDHLCQETLCVNPEHLEPVTNEENLRRARIRPPAPPRLRSCGRGHPDWFGTSKRCFRCSMESWSFTPAQPWVQTPRKVSPPGPLNPPAPVQMCPTRSALLYG